MAEAGGGLGEARGRDGLPVALLVGDVGKGNEGLSKADLLGAGRKAAASASEKRIHPKTASGNEGRLELPAGFR